MQDVSPRQRKPTRDPALDGLRGLAILLIYIFHYGGGLRSGNPAVRAFGYLTQSGWIGVELFFALSGFLITRQLSGSLGRPGTLRNFYARRALRILPLYYATLIAAAAAALLTGAPLEALRPLLLYAGFLQNLPTLVHAALHYPPPLPLHHLWSLAVEEQFYLLWPFLLLAVRPPRRTLALCLGTFALACMFRALLWSALSGVETPSSDWSPFLLSRAGALALGAALASIPFHSLDARQAQRLKRWAAACTVAGLLTFLAIALHTGTFLPNTRPTFVLGLPAIELACAAAVAWAVLPGLPRTLLSGRALGALGRISYGFYVLHLLLEPLFDRIAFALSHAMAGSAYQFVRLLVAFPVTLVAAWLSYSLLERSFLRLKHLFPPAAGSANDNFGDPPSIL